MLFQSVKQIAPVRAVFAVPHSGSLQSVFVLLVRLLSLSHDYRDGVRQLDVCSHSSGSIDFTDATELFTTASESRAIGRHGVAGCAAFAAALANDFCLFYLFDLLNVDASDFVGPAVRFAGQAGPSHLSSRPADAAVVEQEATAAVRDSAAVVHLVDEQPGRGRLARQPVAVDRSELSAAASAVVEAFATGC